MTWRFDKNSVHAGIFLSIIGSLLIFAIVYLTYHTLVYFNKPYVFQEYRFVGFIFEVDPISEERMHQLEIEYRYNAGAERRREIKNEVLKYLYTLHPIGNFVSQKTVRFYNDLCNGK